MIIITTNIGHTLKFDSLEDLQATAERLNGIACWAGKEIIERKPTTLTYILYDRKFGSRKKQVQTLPISIVIKSSSRRKNVYYSNKYWFCT